MSINQFPGVKITFDDLPSTLPNDDRIYPNQASERFPTDSDLNRYPNDRFGDPDYKPAKPLEGRFDPWNGTNDAAHYTDPCGIGIGSSCECEAARKYQKTLDDYHKVVREVVEKQSEKEKTSTQFAEEHSMTDQQVNKVIKANEEAVASNKNEIWISAVIADEIQSRLNHLYTEFKSVVYDNSSNFTDRDKVTVTDDRCEALISVDPKQLEVFIANLKYAAKQASDLVACVPEKPVENPIHPNKPAIAEPTTPKESEMINSSSEDTVMKKGIDKMVEDAKEASKEHLNETYGDPDSKEFSAKDLPDIEPDCESEMAKDKLEYMSGNHMLTPDGIDTIIRGNTPVLPAYHVGMRPSDPTVTPDQWRAMMESNAQINKESIIPGAKPFDPKTVTRFTDERMRYQATKVQPVPPTEPKKADEVPFCPETADIPKDLVEMVEKLPNDIWKYEANQNDEGLVLTLTYDVEPRHISITVNTHAEEVIISTKKDFRGSYNTTLDWSAETAADESIPNSRRLFTWLRQWIKDIMGSQQLA